jgi:predicted RNA-binding protein YlqC (UPF0109 family)
MSSETSLNGMLSLVKYLIAALVELPDNVNITETVDETNTHLISIQVDPQDMGRVIGKSGRIISAIRELVKVKAIKQGKKVRLILL